MKLPSGEQVPFTGRAPDKVGFFQITQGDNTLLHGSAHYADSMEADLRSAAPLDTVPATNPLVIEAAKEDSPWWRPMFVAALILALLAWHFQNPPKKQATESVAPNHPLS